VAHRLAQAVGHVSCGSAVALVHEQHDELVAGAAGHEVDVADHIDDPFGHGGQQLVAGLVAEALVDAGQPVDADLQHADQPGIRVEPRMDPAADLLAVHEAGERVVQRGMREAGAAQDLVMDVAQRDDAQDPALAVGPLRRQRHPPVAAVGGEHPVLLAHGEPHRDLVAVVGRALAVLGVDELERRPPEQLVGVPAEHADHGLRDPRHRAVGRGLPHHVRGVLGEHAVAVLALADALLHGVPLRDVAPGERDAVPALHRADVVAPRLAADVGVRVGVVVEDHRLAGLDDVEVALGEAVAGERRVDHGEQLAQLLLGGPAVVGER
jgi:hypothetical protein